MAKRRRPEIVWHYTTGEKFALIVESGTLLTEADTTPEAIARMPDTTPGLWFSADPYWEPTANKGIRHRDGTVHTATHAQMSRLAGGLVRFAVTPTSDILSWHEYAQRIPKQEAQALIKYARRRGARASNWYISLEPVPRDRWVAVDVFQDGQWVGVPFDPASRQQPD